MSEIIGGIPPPDKTPPDAVLLIAAGRDTRAVWENEGGGLTFEIGTGGDRCFVKWAPRGSSLTLDAEIDRLRWAIDYVTVPPLLDGGSDLEGSWIVTSALPGESAVTPRWRDDPLTTVRALGEGLRALHEALPVETCPFSWSIEDRTEAILDRGRLEPRLWDPVHQPLSVDVALGLLAKPPPIDELVVCHGDACSPNTLIGDDGRFTGHVDLGELGVADRWADLAIATWSTAWNYGPGHEDLLLDAYGIDPDTGRTAYYRLLWDLSP